MFLKNMYYGLKFGKIVNAALFHNNEIYVGKTHSECFIQKPKGVLINAEQGFVTEKNKFVDRKVALCIAKFYKQIKYKHPPYDILMSEDLMYRKEN